MTEENPVYPRLPTVDKYRRIKNPTREQERAYGQAVLAAIRALQRSELMRVVTVPKPHCASGTAETTGEGILAAIRRQHIARLHAEANRIRRARTDDELREQYQLAMEEKRKRLAVVPAAVAPLRPRQIAARKAWVTIRAKRAAKAGALEAAE
jgi:hypothetical protein